MMQLGRRQFIGGAVALTCGSGAICAVPGEVEVARPEDFGAKGDGLADDTDAFAAMSAHVTRRGGGMIELRQTTYRVGRQLASNSDQEWAYNPSVIMDFRSLRDPLVIRGNGARLKCTPGLRFGTFDRRGEPVRLPMPNYRLQELAVPYHAMINVVGCSGSVEITDLELDGSLGELRIGGPYGDIGHQIPANGLFLRDNRGSELIRNLYTHHHALDGIQIDGDPRRRTRSRFENVVSEYNGRQGVSLVGGRGYEFERCKFNHTGRSAVASAPCAGVDIEAEGGKTNRDITFTDCEFSNNVGCGLTADQGDNSHVSFKGCTFVGTTNWSAWPRMPYFQFEGCTFVGPIVNAFGDSADAARATKFLSCTFRDDPALSPTGEVYMGQNTDGPIADLSGNPNVLFSRCSFLLTHAHTLPWVTNVVLFSDCTMRQKSPTASYPRGTYLGTNTITGAVDLYGAQFLGTLTVNGTRIPRSR